MPKTNSTTPQPALPSDDMSRDCQPKVIGDRRLAGKSRRDAEARFQAIFDHALDGMVLVNIETRAVTSANPAFLHMTGYGMEELSALRVENLHPQDALPEIIGIFEKLAGGESSFGSNIRVRRRDGSIFRADINGSPFELNGKRYVLGEVRDITERLAAQEALREQEARHHRIYDSMLDAFAMIDMSGFLTDFNQVFLDMLGYSADELKGKTYLDLTPAKWHEAEKKMVAEELIPQGQSAIFEKEYIHKDGTIFPVELKAVLLKDKYGQPESMWAIIRDISERRRAEKALRESEERFRSLLWSIPSVAVQSYSLDGTTRYWNLASEQLYGYAQTEALGKNLLDLIVPPEMADQIKAAIEEMAATGQPIPPGELSLRRKNGSRVDVFSSHACVQIAGHPPELFCIDIDLSELKKAEAARRQTEQRLAVALASSPVAVFEQDLDLRYTWLFNRPKLGYMAGEVLGKTDADLLESASATRLTVAKRAVLENGQPIHQEISLRHPNGSLEHYDLHIEPRVDSDGRTIGLIGAAIDITSLAEQQKELSNALAQRQWAEAVLREREEQLAVFVEYAPASIAMFDRKMRYLAASRHWIQDHCILQKDIRGYCHYDLIPDIPERWRQIHARCLAGAIERCDEDSFIGADRREHWLRWEARPWQATSGEIGGIIIFCEDITEARNKRQELAQARLDAEMAKVAAERAYAAKSHFLAAASHDLRQPLHALDLYVGVIADRVPPACADIVANMKQCTLNLSNLLNELLDLSKLDAGGVKPHIQDFSLSAFLEQIASTHAPLAEQKDLLFRVARTRLTGRSDPLLLQQIVANLVGNAIRYTERGSVLIGVRRRDGRLWIEVWDTGIGIPTDKQEEIFEPFKQLGNPERNRESGTGLGLALVQRLANVLGLKIRVSSWLGRGSLFAIEVPRGGQKEPAIDSPYPALAKNGRRQRIGLIEDERLVRDATRLALEHLGHEVITAMDTEQLLARLGDGAPEIVIADYRLAGNANGVDAITAIRQRYGQSIGAVIITGDTDPDVLQRIATTGLRVLNKPLHLDELQNCLAEIGDTPD